jgi:hypothetical protein
MAKLVADQLSRLATLNRHQLAGQVANLDFWLAQVQHGLEVVDGYRQRFRRLKAAHEKHVMEHRTTEFFLSDPCCTQGKPVSPRRVSDKELKDARRALCEATRRFLLRCWNDGFVEEAVLRQACAGLGIAVDATDFRPR